MFCVFCVPAGYWAFSNAGDKFGMKKAASKKKVRAEAVAFDEDEWVKGTPYDVDKRRRAAAANKPTKQQ
jgi:hypothetical protein